MIHPIITFSPREMACFFISLAGFVVIANAVFLMGLSFTILLAKLENTTPMPITELFYATPFFWLILLLAAPLITMRSFALEKYSGTFETLMTTPVSDFQVVLAKFFGALIFFLVMWLPLLGCIVLLGRYANDSAILDWGTIASTYLGIFLIGSLFMSLGCFASALTRSQIVAAMISLAIGISLFLLSFLGDRLASQSTLANDVLTYTSMVEHMQDFARGIVDTRAVVFYLTGTIFFLLLTYRVVQSRRWK
jgi:ABC-2 type transport system permease protein